MVGDGATGIERSIHLDRKNLHVDLLHNKCLPWRIHSNSDIHRWLTTTGVWQLQRQCDGQFPKQAQNPNQPWVVGHCWYCLQLESLTTQALRTTIDWGFLVAITDYFGHSHIHRQMYSSFSSAWSHQRACKHFASLTRAVKMWGRSGIQRSITIAQLMEAFTHTWQNTPFLIVGNKSDLVDDFDTITKLASRRQSPITREQVDCVSSESWRERQWLKSLVLRPIWRGESECSSHWKLCTHSERAQTGIRHCHQFCADGGSLTRPSTFQVQEVQPPMTFTCQCTQLVFNLNEDEAVPLLVSIGSVFGTSFQLRISLWVLITFSTPLLCGIGRSCFVSSHSLVH